MGDFSTMSEEERNEVFKKFRDSYKQLTEKKRVQASRASARWKLRKKEGLPRLVGGPAYGKPIPKKHKIGDEVVVTRGWGSTARYVGESAEILDFHYLPASLRKGHYDYGVTVRLLTGPCAGRIVRVMEGGIQKDVPATDLTHYLTEAKKEITRLERRRAWMRLAGQMDRQAGKLLEDRLKEYPDLKDLLHQSGGSPGAHQWLDDTLADSLIEEEFPEIDSKTRSHLRNTLVKQIQKLKESSGKQK